MRGKGFVAGFLLGGVRITPAYAGKSMGYNQRRLGYGDHPRLCGEKQPDTFGQLTQLGSPPPMRGKDSNVTVGRRNCRITPAYAGKRDTPPLSTSASWDHPRLCGEKPNAVLHEINSKGSPPPMRGKGIQSHDDSINPGITPAYAGKSCQAEILKGCS